MKKSLVIGGIAGLLGLCLCGGVVAGGAALVSGGEDTAADAGNPDTAKGKVGEAVRDGKFEFTVKSVKCGVDKVGSDYTEEKAQGQFCLVSVKVKNIGDEARYFSDSDQKAYDAAGTKYSADTGAGIYANSDADTFLNQINPGNQISGVVVFDIPKDVSLTTVELHGSAFSGGVTVSLG